MTPDAIVRSDQEAELLRRHLADDVRYYLQQQPRQLPSRYLYDPLGSALFNAICELPWYRVTRAETRLIAAHAPELFATLHELGRIVELGAGNGVKLAVLLSARPPTGTPLRVGLVDVSRTALDAACRAAAEYPDVHVTGYHATYEQGLERIARETSEGRTLVLFLGSNIGNFDPPSADALLAHVRRSVAPGDWILLGTDLVKREGELLLAYDDPLGVTAAFNLNLLVRLNQELGADADLNQFEHSAVWNEEASRVEMHLVSRSRQTLHVPGAGVEVTLEAGESIWTESSYKYRLDEVTATLERAGFQTERQWVDDQAQFALTLAQAGHR